MEHHQDFNLEYKVYAEKLCNNYIMKVLMEVFQLNTSYRSFKPEQFRFKLLDLESAKLQILYLTKCCVEFNDKVPKHCWIQISFRIPIESESAVL